MSRKKNFRPSNQQRTQRGAEGGTAVKAPPQIEQLWNSKKTRYAPGSLVRAYVVAVYAGDDPTAARSPLRTGTADKVSTYLCDVLISEGTYSGILPRVPIMSGAFGITDRILMLPRPASKDLKAGNSITLATTKTARATPIHDSDGDLVIVAFLDNDYNKPVIIGALQHPQTKAPVSFTDTAPKFEAILRGNRIAIEDDGKIVIDATAQTTGVSIVDGSEVPALNPTIEIKGDAGTVTLNATGIQIEMAVGMKTTIGGFNPVGIAESLVKAGGWNDLFGAGGAFWTEAFPIIAAAAGLFGLPTTALAAALATFSAGVSSTGATLTTDSVEGE